MKIAFTSDVNVGSFTYQSGQDYDVDPALAARFIAQGVAYAWAGDQAPVSGAGKNTAVERLAGGTQPSSNSSNITRLLKKAAKADFDCVRIHLYSRELSPATVFRGVVAATETASMASLAVAAHPTVGGTQTKALRSAVGQPGWAALTWNGAATGDMPAAAGTYRPARLTSDWVDLPSVPRADGGSLPLVMFRIYHDASANGAVSITSNFMNDPSPPAATAWNNETARPWWEVYQVNTIIGADGVSNLLLEPAGAASQNSSMWAAIEFGYRTRAISVLGIGDSLTENGGNFAWGTYGAWGLRGCNLASSPARPVTWFNAGVGGQNSTTFIPGAEDALAAFSPTHALYELLSPNDDAANGGNAGTLSAATIAASMSRLQRVARACKAAGTKLVVWAGLPNNSYTLAHEQLRLQLKAQGMAFCAANGCDFLDLEPYVGTGASPNRMLTSFDTTHPDNALMDIMAGRWAAYLATQ